MTHSQFLEDALAAHIRVVGAEDAAVDIVNAFTHLTAQRLIFVSPAMPPVLTDSELQTFERKAAGVWVSAKAVWFAVRPAEVYEHQIAINLGRQLAARYRKQRKVGPTRQYWIESRTITDAKA